MVIPPLGIMKMLEWPNQTGIPVLKDGATDKQKILYADFIKQYVEDDQVKSDFPPRQANK